MSPLTELSYWINCSQGPGLRLESVWIILGIFLNRSSIHWPLASVISTISLVIQITFLGKQWQDGDAWITTKWLTHPLFPVGTILLSLFYWRFTFKYLTAFPKLGRPKVWPFACDMWDFFFHFYTAILRLRSHPEAVGLGPSWRCSSRRNQGLVHDKHMYGINLPFRDALEPHQMENWKLNFLANWSKH